MPLRDHFRPPLQRDYHWESIHSAWAVHLTETLNTGGLPDQYLASVHVELRRTIEDYGAAFRRRPAMSIPAHFPDSIEVRIMSRGNGRKLVAVIEVVSPGNKD